LSPSGRSGGHAITRAADRASNWAKRLKVDETPRIPRRR
jgi:hypothetical protein